MVEFAKEITNMESSGRPIRLSPRRRIHLRDQSRQQSLDSGYLSANRNYGCSKQGSLDSKVEEILETYSNGNVVIKCPQDLSALNETDENGSSIQVSDRKCESRERKVETKDASNGVAVFCKHCGHPVDAEN